MEMFYTYFYFYPLRISVSALTSSTCGFYSIFAGKVFVLVDGVTPIINLCSWKDLASKVMQFQDPEPRLHSSR